MHDTTGTEPAIRAGRREWVGLAVLALPTLLLSLDLSFLYLALPNVAYSGNWTVAGDNTTDNARRMFLVAEAANALGTGRSIIVFRPGSARITICIAFTSVTTVAVSPKMPP